MHVYVYVYAGICGICTNICTLECPLHIHPELRMGYMRISQGVYPDASAERLKLKLRTELVLRTECVLRPEEGSQLTTARNLGPTHPETFRIPFVNLSRSYPGIDHVVPSTWIPDASLGAIYGIGDPELSLSFSRFACQKRRSKHLPWALQKRSRQPRCMRVCVACKLLTACRVS